VEFDCVDVVVGFVEFLERVRLSQYIIPTLLCFLSKTAYKTALLTSIYLFIYLFQVNIEFKQ
jgi:hypothetical protein